MNNSNIIPFLSARGRIGIGRYWLYWLLITIAYFACALLIATNGENEFSSIFTTLTLFSGLIYLQMIKRMHDCGRSGWYSLVPVYNFILTLTRGDEGTNEYGQDPQGNADDISFSNEAIDHEISADVTVNQSYTIQDELKQFLIYIIVSRFGYLMLNIWWSYTVSNASDRADYSINTYQLLFASIDSLFIIWLFVLMGKSVNRWLQLIYLFMIVQSTLFAFVKLIF